jgi:orotidine-5'-phosphate decarboxylase
MQSFADRLAAGVQRCGNPVLVGLDPRAASLPAGLLPPDKQSEPRAVAAAFQSFCCGVIDAVAPLVCVVKPQAAFFEQYGPPGMNALAEVIRYARRQGLLVILDGKRNDIGTTAAAYAEAYLGADSAWSADALTVSPYLGDDSLTPFADRAKATGSGIFVLVKTSNPGGGAFQDYAGADGPLYRRVAGLVERLAAETAGECGYGAVGAVVGATYPAQLAELREAMPHTWFLIPGFGAQGGSAQDVAAGFDHGGLPAGSSSPTSANRSARATAPPAGKTRWPPPRKR